MEEGKGRLEEEQAPQTTLLHNMTHIDKKTRMQLKDNVQSSSIQLNQPIFSSQLSYQVFSTCLALLSISTAL
jgi:hypothetical protein